MLSLIRLYSKQKDKADNIGKPEHPRRIVFKLDNGNIAVILTR